MTALLIFLALALLTTFALALDRAAPQLRPWAAASLVRLAAVVHPYAARREIEADASRAWRLIVKRSIEARARRRGLS